MESGQPLILSDETIAIKRRRALGQLQYALNDGIPIPLSQAESSPLTDLFGCYEAVYTVLEKRLEGYDDAIRIPFASMYAVDAAATYVYEHYGLEDTTKTFPHPVFVAEPTHHGRWRGLFRQGLQEYLSGPEEERGSKFSAWCKELSSAAREAASALEYSVIAREAGELKAQIDNVHYPGLLLLQNEVAFDKRDCTEERVVGNVEMMRSLSHALYGLAHFNGKRNLLYERVRFPKTVNIYGAPGTGKTLGIRQSFLAARAAYEGQMAVPFEMLQVNNAFKSKIFSESSENLRKLFKRAGDGNAAYLLVADDIESIFHDRQGLDHNPEEKNITNTLLNELEGLLSKYKGNYLFIATSNYPLKLDPALDERLSELVLEATGPVTRGDYAHLFRNLLSKGVAAGYVRVRDWSTIGNYAEMQTFPGSPNPRLSGRQVKDIVTSLVMHRVLPSIQKRELLDEPGLESSLKKTWIGEEEVVDEIKAFVKRKEVQQKRGKNG